MGRAKSVSGASTLSGSRVAIKVLRDPSLLSLSLHRPCRFVRPSDDFMIFPFSRSKKAHLV